MVLLRIVSLALCINMFSNRLYKYDEPYHWKEGFETPPLHWLKLMTQVTLSGKKVGEHL